MVHEFTVEDLKTRLDKFLSEQLSHISRSQIQRDIEGGCVEVNGQKVIESKFIVRLKDKVRYESDEKKKDELTPANIPLKVLYNDHGLLIIDKPAGLTVHPGAGFKGQTLASALLYNFKNIHLVGEEHRPGIVHRLDKDTSGVILVATTPEMYDFLKDAFATRRVKKEYIALVKGKVPNQHGFIDAALGKSRTDFRKQTTKDPVEPKEALTEYLVLERLFSSLSGRLDDYTLVRVKLHTGKTHQIRVHFHSLGFPLAGDELYGGRNVFLPGLNRQFLHAKKIEVQLPDGVWIEAESELPEDLRKVLKELNSKTVNQL